MKFTIDREAFVDALFSVGAVVKTKSTLPVLASCLIEAKRSGRLIVHGTNLDVWVRAEVPADVSKPGRAVIDHSRLFRTVKSDAAGPVECKLTPRSGMTIDQSRVHARLCGILPGEFPTEPESFATPLRMRSATLVDLIGKTEFCTARDEVRPSFSCGYLHRVGRHIRMTTTDGHRFAMVTLDPGEGEEYAGFRSALIPQPAMGVLSKLMGGDRMLQLGINGDDLRVESEDLVVVVRLKSAEYVDYEPAFQHPVLVKAIINRDVLVASLKRAAIYAGKDKLVTLTFEDGTTTVFAGGELGDISEPIPCQCKPGELDGVSVHYSHRYLRAVLDVLEGDDAIIEVTGHDAPTYIRDGSRDDMCFIVMPMDPSKES